MPCTPRRPITLAVFSDPHAGSTVGLCPPEGTRTDDGQEVRPSPVQVWLWEKVWLRYWKRVAQVRKANGGKLVVVGNGDMVDGPAHHNTTQTMALGKDAQSYIATRIFDPVVSVSPDKVYLVRGTEVHVGANGSDEESLAATLRHKLPIQRDPDTQLWSYWVLDLDLHGLHVNFQHHGKGVSDLAPEGISRLAARIRRFHHDKGLTPPRLAIRSHLHVYRDSYDTYPTRAIITPALQLKTAYVHKVAPESIADLGALIVTIHPDSRYAVEPFLVLPERRSPMNPFSS